MSVLDTLDISTFSTALGFAIFSVLIFKLTRRDPRISKFLKEIPGPLDVPLLGNLLLAVQATTPHAAYQLSSRLCQKYGPVMKLWVGNKPYVILSGASECEKLLSSYAHVEKSGDYDILRPWIMDALFLASSAKWHSRRKLLTPAFHFQILQDFLPTFNDAGNRLVRILALQSDGHFDIAPFISRCALDIICETSMGVHVQAQENSDIPEVNEYVEALYNLDNVLSKKLIQPVYWSEFIYNLTSLAGEEKKNLDIVHTFTSKVIQERRVERQKCSVVDSSSQSSSKRRPALLDLLLDEEERDPNFTDADVREETEGFMVAGHETTTLSVLWVIFLLAAHPEFQKRVQDEIERECGNSTADLTSSDISKLVFLEACIKESLRMFPPFAAFIRKVGEDITLDDGKIIPKGVTAAVVASVVQRDPKFFPSPDYFNPLRFLNNPSSNSTARHPFAFLPFSAGPRNCLGQKFAMNEMKVLLTKLFTNFDIQTLQTLRELRPCPQLLVRPEDGKFIVKLAPRI